MEPTQIIELLQSAGLLGFSVLALGALLSRRLITKGELDEAYKVIAYEREQKDRAFELAKSAQASHDRLADAVEARNRLDAERLEAQRRNPRRSGV